MVDLDQDGRQDCISGSWPGEIYWFRRLANQEFAEAEILKDKNGETINVGTAAAAFVTDWHNDGDFDLVIGTITGQVELVENVSSGKKLQFIESRTLDLKHSNRGEHSDAAPVVVDWDGDGKDDLLVGAGDGSVSFYRNIGSVTNRKFSTGRCIVPKSPIGWGSDQIRNAGDWGLRSKICVTDWNGDGKLDVLLGDLCGGFQGKPGQLASERQQERAAIEALPNLQRQWAQCFRDYRALPQAQDTDAKSLLSEIRTLKKRITSAQAIVVRYQPQRQSHGFVWLFLRR